MKRFFYLSLLVLLSSCQKFVPDGAVLQRGSGDAGVEGTFLFSPGMASSNYGMDLQKQNEPLEVTSGGRPYYLHCFSGGFDSAGDRFAQTKSAPVDVPYPSFSVSGYAFAGSWTGEASPTLFYCRTVSGAPGTPWPLEDCFWPGEGFGVKFFAVAPASAGGLGWESGASDPGAPVISYTVPAEVSAQTDILEAVTDVLPGDYPGTVPLSFSHALSGLRFAVSDLGTDCYVTSLEVSGLYSRGSHAVGSSSWTDLSSPGSWSFRMDEPVTREGGATLTGGEKTLLMIPQECPDGAKVVLTLEDHGFPMRIECPLTGLLLRPGCLHTFILSAEGTGWIYDDLEVNGGTVIPSNIRDGESFTLGSVTSWRVSSAGVRLPVPWAVAGYREQGQAEFQPAPPAWLSGVTSAGEGGWKGEPFSVTLSGSRYVFRSCEVLLRTEGDSPREKAVTVVTTGDEMLTFEVRTTSGETGHIYFQESNHNWYHPVLEYSRDGGLTWTSLPAWDGTGGSDIEVRVGDVLLLRGDNPRMACHGAYANGISFFSTDEGTTFWCSGDLASLIDRNAYASTMGTFTYLFDGCKGCLNHPEKDIYCSLESLVPAMFYGTFRGSGVTRCMDLPWISPNDMTTSCYGYMYADTGIVEPMEVLPLEDVGHCSYIGMFSGCTRLVRAPEIRARRVRIQTSWNSVKGGNFELMFSGCTSLVHAPDLFVENMAENTFRNMFRGCTSLVDYPEGLFEYDDRELTSACYEGMFDGCSSLREAPELKARMLSSSCYLNMFRNCTSLETVPSVLPAEVVPESSYCGMFSGCKSLRGAPVLKAVSVENQAMRQMFYGCTSMESFPEWHVSSMSGGYCASSMFDGCSSLTDFPSVLPAEDVTQYSYAYMFRGCVSLRSAPDISARTLASYGMHQMFNNCSSLVDPPSALYVEEVAGRGYSQMFYKCGSLTRAPELYARSVAIEGMKEMFSYCCSLTEVPSFPVEEISGGYEFNSMFFNCHALEDFPAEIKVRRSGERTFTRMFINCSSLKKGPVMHFSDVSGVAAFYEMFAYCSTLRSVSLVIDAPSLSSECCYGMFRDCFELETGIHELSSTSLGAHCYRVMFYRCRKLREIPAVLPAPDVPTYGYSAMFNGCHSITSAPEILAESLGSYSCSDMFWDTPALVYSPDFHTVSVGAYACQNMFRQSGIVHAPALPATELSERCYRYMFAGSGALIDTPELPATVMAPYCYEYMFGECNALTAAPELPSVSLAEGCYQQMFANIVSSFVSAPSVLPATELAVGCYRGMFTGCLGLTRAPLLPAPVLVRECYYQMFYNTSVREVTCLATDINASNCTYNWLRNISGTFRKAPGMESWPRNTSGIPAGWTVLDAS